MTDPVFPTGRLLREDEEALTALSFSYAAAADQRDGERFAALFVADGELVVPRYPDDLRPVVTRAGADVLRQVPDGLRRFDRTFHVIGNTSFAVVGDTATGEVQCIAHHLAAEAAETGVAADPAWVDTVWFIRYGDAYARGGSGWRIVRRVVHLQWVERRAVERVGPQPGTGSGGGGPA